MGGVIFSKDVNAYIEMIESFGIETGDILIYFEFLKELGNLFMVRPENLKIILQEGVLKVIDSKLLYPLICQRSDFKSSSIDEMFSDFGSNKFMSFF